MRQTFADRQSFVRVRLGLIKKKGFLFLLLLIYGCFAFLFHVESLDCLFFLLVCRLKGFTCDLRGTQAAPSKKKWDPKQEKKLSLREVLNDMHIL